MIAIAGLWLQVQMGALVRPETVTVGQHFNATIRVRAPGGALVRFPARPDSASAIDTLAAGQQQDVHGAGFVESTMSYTLAAWDTGAQRIGLPDVAVTTPSGQRMVSLHDMQVYVRSVLPADTSLRKPKPPRPAVTVRVFNLVPWLIAAAAVLLIGLLTWLWRRRRRKREGPLGPLAWANREFARIDSMRWLESGEAERYAIAMANVLRGYLARAVPAAPVSATTRELALSLRSVPGVPLDRIIELLEGVDLLKFAAARAATERAVQIGVEARGIVRDTHAALTVAAEAAPARSAA
jgi:hypothetical protein